MLKGRILGIFCWICLFSECFFEQQGCGVAVGFCLQNGCGLCLQEGCGLCLFKAVGFCLLEGCELCLLDGCELACRKVVDFTCRKVVGFACRKVVGFCLFLSLFLRDLVCWRVNIVCSKRESSLLGQRKQLPGIDYNYCLDRWSEDFLM